jgi:hypothetical protein
MSRRVEFSFPFLAHYEVVPLDRIDRSGGKRAYSFPDAVPVDPQQELADRPILEIRPGRGEPWVGVFCGGEWSVPPAIPGRLIGWPDELSVCVAYAGGGVVVRTDEPTNSYEIDCDPITGFVAVPERELLVFCDFLGLVAYGRDGLLWRSPRLALDDLRIDGLDGDDLHVAGYFGSQKLDSFVVDLATGLPRGQPFEPHH